MFGLTDVRLITCGSAFFRALWNVGAMIRQRFAFDVISLNVHFQLIFSSISVSKVSLSSVADSFRVIMVDCCVSGCTWHSE